MLLRRATHVYLGRRILPPYITGAGVAAAQDAVVVGAGLRIITGGGTPAADVALVVGAGIKGTGGSGAAVADPATVAASGVRSAVGSGTPAADASVVVGVGDVFGSVDIELTVANSQELKDAQGNVWISLANIAWEWYDDPSSTAGEPLDSGLFTTSVIGEATITVLGSNLANGEYGQLILYHPSDPDIRATLRVPVVK